MNCRMIPRAVSLYFLMLVAFGCGGPAADAPDLHEAFGTVTLDGKPVVDAKVMFQASNQGGTVGRTNEEGYYEIHFNDEQKGAYPGTNTVRISTAVAYDADPDADEDELEASLKETLPAVYNGMTTLTVDIPGNGPPYDFPLTSDPNAYKPAQ